MKFKNISIEDEFMRAPLLLQHLACDIDRFTRENFNKEITLTRILGKISGDSGVHEAYRAFDIREQFRGKSIFSHEQIDLITKWVNNKYKRIDGYDTCLYHSFKGGPLHFHCQIPHESEKLRGTNYTEE